jgi:hypothetical protein
METITGNWEFYWKYDGVSNYSNTSIEFKADGTWSSGSVTFGNWFERNGMLNFNYNDSDGLIYLGVYQGGAMVGVMNINNSSSRGVWYAVEAGSSEATVRTAEANAQIPGVE